MYKNAIKMLGRAIFERFYQIFGVFISKNMVFSGFQSGVFFGVLRFPFGVFGPKLSGHTAGGGPSNTKNETFLIWKIFSLQNLISRGVRAPGPPVSRPH